MFLRDLAIRIGFNNTQAVSSLREADRQVDTVKANARSMGQMFEQVGHSMGRVGGYLTTRLTLPLVGIGVASIKAASDLEAMERMFNVSFGNMSDDARNWANSFASSLNRSTSTAMGLMAVSQDLLVGFGATTDEAFNLSKEMISLSYDLGAFRNEDPSQILNSMKSAMSGAHMSARALGVVINENTIALAMQRMGLQGAFADLTEVEKAQVRYNVILAGSEHAVGMAADSTDTFAEKLRQLKERVVDVREIIGTPLLESGNRFLDWAHDGISAFENLNEQQQIQIIQWGVIAAAIPPVLMVMGSMVRNIAAITGAFKGLAIALKANPLILGATALTAAGTLLYEKQFGFDSRKGEVTGDGFYKGDTAPTMHPLQADTGLRAPTPEEVNTWRAQHYSPTVNVTVNDASSNDTSEKIKRVLEQSLSDHYRQNFSELATGTVR